MKRTIVSLTATIALVFTGCFIDSDTATVRINLGNMPVAKVEKKSIFDRIVMLFVKEAVAQGVPEWTGVVVVHLGAFDQNNQLVAKKSINASAVPANGNITFDVPAGIRRKIVVLGEVNDGYIDFHGVSDEIDLNAGTVVTVPIQVLEFDIDLGYAPFVNNQAVWNNLAGASHYNVYNNDGVTVYSGKNNNYTIPTPFDQGFYFIEVEFSFSGIKSKQFDIYLC